MDTHNDNARGTRNRLGPCTGTQTPARRRTGVRIFTTVLLALLAAPSLAAVFAEDLDHRGDARLTVDNQSGLEWLDLTATVGMSATQALAAYGDQGFRLANADEVNTLLRAFGLSRRAGTGPGCSTEDLAFAERMITMLGSTERVQPPGGGGGPASAGYYDDGSSGDLQHFVQVDLREGFPGAEGRTAVCNVHCAGCYGDGLGIFLVRDWLPPTLEPIDLNDDGEIDAYYDAYLDISWLADANYAETIGYEYPELGDAAVEDDGTMPHFVAEKWMETLRIHGVGGWRLPRRGTDPYDSGPFPCNATGELSNASFLKCNRLDEELAHLYYRVLGNDAALMDAGPFRHLNSEVYFYQELEPCPDPYTEDCGGAWYFDFADKPRWWLPSCEQPGCQFVDEELYARVWPVHDGHVARIAAGDRDGDGVADVVDNCPTVENPDQFQSGYNAGRRFGDDCVDPSVHIAGSAVVPDDLVAGPGTEVWARAVIAGGVSLGADVYIGHDARVGADTVIGDGTYVEPAAQVGESVVAGRDVTIHRRGHIADGGRIGDHSSIGKDSLISTGTTIQDGVTVGQLVSIGERSALLDGARIGIGSTLGSRVVIGRDARAMYDVALGDATNLRDDAVLEQSVEVLLGVEVGWGALVRRCATVDADVPEYTEVHKGDCTH